jgi:hypothetical protein
MARAEEILRRLANGSGLHDHVADDLALLDQLVCLDGAVQGQCCPNGVLDPSLLKPARQICDPPFPGRCWKFVHNEEPDGRPAHDHRAELETNLRSVGTVGDTKAVSPDDLREQSGIPGNVHLHDPVNPAPSGDLPYAVRHCFSFLVDDLVGSGCLCVRCLLVRTHRSDDLCSPKQLRELDCVVPNRTSASRDEDRLTLR